MQYKNILVVTLSCLFTNITQAQESFNFVVENQSNNAALIKNFVGFKTAFCLQKDEYNNDIAGLAIARNIGKLALYGNTYHNKITKAFDISAEYAIHSTVNLIYKMQQNNIAQQEYGFKFLPINNFKFIITFNKDAKDIIFNSTYTINFDKRQKQTLQDIFNRDIKIFKAGDDETKEKEQITEPIDQGIESYNAITNDQSLSSLKTEISKIQTDNYVSLAIKTKTLNAKRQEKISELEKLIEYFKCAATENNLSDSDKERCLNQITLCQQVITSYQQEISDSTKSSFKTIKAGIIEKEKQEKLMQKTAQFNDYFADIKSITKISYDSIESINLHIKNNQTLEALQSINSHIICLRNKKAQLVLIIEKLSDLKQQTSASERIFDPESFLHNFIEYQVNFCQKKITEYQDEIETLENGIITKFGSASVRRK